MKIALIYADSTQQVGTNRVFELTWKSYFSLCSFTVVHDSKGTIELGNHLTLTALLQHILAAAEYFKIQNHLHFPAFGTSNIEYYKLVAL